MLKNLKSILFACILSAMLANPGKVFSQKIHAVDGNSEVRLEVNMTKEQAYEKAEELAKINAIESVFGSVVDQQTDIRMKDGRVNYDVLGSTKVRGEWIRTREIKFNEETRQVQGRFGKEQELWINCVIKGEVRECVSRVNIDFKTLHCPLLQCYRTAFFTKEDIYLYFKSPVDGFLSVYLDDGNNAYRLLPYKSMGTLNAVKITGDKDYIFFSRDKELQYDPQYRTDALELYTDKEIEYNDIYIVFAESPYKKPILDEVKEIEDGFLLPKSLPSEKFRKWLGDYRAEMLDFQAVRVKISIER